MKIGWIGGGVAALFLVGMIQDAHATTWSVTCTGGTPSQLAELTGGTGSGTFASANFPGDPGGLGGTGSAPDALGALLGTPDQAPDNQATLNSAGSSYVGSFSTSLSSGDLVEINGFCEQVVEVRTSGITITGPSGDIALMAAAPTSFALINGVDAQFLVNGADRVIINDIMIGNSVATVTLPSSGFSYAGSGLLTIFGGANVFLENAQIIDSSSRGIFMAGSSSLTALSSFVTNNGIGNSDQTANGGIEATGDSSIFLGKPTGLNPTTVSANHGDGIRLSNASSLYLNAGTVTGNGQKQLLAVASSSMILNGNNGFTANGNAPVVAVSAASNTNTDASIAVEAGSSLFIAAQASVSAGSSGTTIMASGSGTVLLEGSFISGGVTTLEVTGGSLLALAGGNYICNGTLATGTLTPGCTAFTGATNFAIEVDHVGALYDVGAIPGFNFTAATDTITGAGALQLQSTADLGQGQISGQPSLAWTTGSNGISVSQNSSLRMEGGVTITGAIDLAQGSNGFVNSAKAAGVHNTNVVTGGISCPFSIVPASHLQLANNSLAASTPATVVATSFSGATSPQCLPF